MIRPDTLAYLVRMLCAGKSRPTAPQVSIRCIAANAQCSKTTVRRHQELLSTCTVPRTKLLRLSPEELADLFNPRTPIPVRWGAVRRQWTRHPRWSKRDLWAWYREDELRRGNRQLCSYGHFARELGKFPEDLQPRMRRLFDPGQVLFVDFGGKKGLAYRDAEGKVRPAKLFVAVLGFSQLTFATCVDGEDVEDWLLACTRALQFYGGAPLTVVPDNLKAAVLTPRPAPVINARYLAWATHYGTAIQPARPHRPTDKGMVENAVKQVQNLLLRDLADRPAASLAALNKAVAARLQTFNARFLTGRRVSRWQQFQQEKKALCPLPADPFQDPDQAGVQILHQVVPPDYTVRVRGHRYTVPSSLIGRAVEVRVSKLHVEVVHKGRQVVTHDLAPPGQIGPALTRLPAHAPPEHRAMERTTRMDVEAWAATVGPKMVELVGRHFQRQVPLQGLQEACDVRALSRWHPLPVLEWAAHEALLVREHGYRKLKALLENPPGAEDPAVQRAVKPKKPRAAPHPRAVRSRVKHGSGTRTGRVRRRA